MFAWFRRRRRARVRAAPFPSVWLEVLEKHVPYYESLSLDDRAELRGHIQVFLAEKPFEGCGGLEINDDIRVTVAAHACLLLLHRETEYYPELSSILVYPHAYVAKKTRTEGGVVIEEEQARLGESWTRGVVVLAWDDVLRSAHDVRDGHNVVFHEFAHQLDQEDGEADGAPQLPRFSMYGTWARVFTDDYERLMQADERGKKTVIDSYGAVSPAEFFAVVTETFFEKPIQLRTKHPELYQQLESYYRQDPAAARERKR